MEMFTNGEITRQVVESAQDGNAQMQYQLANYLYAGDRNKAPNPEQGFAWMTAAGHNGSIQAQKVLGLLYTNGQYAPWPEKDLTKAIYWYQQAASGGDAQAMYWLYCCYDKGIGVVYDREKAMYWLKEAARHGYDVEIPPIDDEPQNRPEVRPARTNRQDKTDLEEDFGKRKPESKHRKKQESRSLQEKSLDMARSGVFTAKYDIRYVKNSLPNTLIALSVSMIAFCLIALLLHLGDHSFFGSSKKMIFIAVCVIVTLAVTGYTFFRTYRQCYQDSKKNAWFRKLSFYKQYRTDIDRLSPQLRMQYDYYSSLEKSFLPLSWSEALPRNPFQAERGYMFMGLIYGHKDSHCRPDLTILTEKSLYIVECVKLSGSLRGDVMADEWEQLFEGGRSRLIPNPVHQNQRRMEIIRKDFQETCPWMITKSIPFHSIVVLPPDVDTHLISGPWKSGEQMLLQASPEELRSQIEVMESKLTLQEDESRQLLKAIEQIAEDYSRRQSAFNQEML